MEDKVIDLHTHSLLSDGQLLPGELVRRAYMKGYEAIAITDHVDESNIDFVVPRLVKICKRLNSLWDIKVIPGIEVTHVPLEDMERLIDFAKREGAKIIVVHGETISEPVLPGTNRKALELKIDILAHPGRITRDDAALAAKNGVFLELTSRKQHRKTNKLVAAMALKAGARLIINTDAHTHKDLITMRQQEKIARECGLNKNQTAKIFKDTKKLTENL